MKNTKKLIIARHGVAPKDPSTGGSLDTLVPESVGRLYDAGARTLAPYTVARGIHPKDAFLYHSPMNRTRYTGQAILAGAFGMSPMPQRQEDLEDIQGLREVQTKVVDALGYEDLLPRTNMDVLKKVGTAKYNELWFADPEATEMGGVPIMSFDELIRTKGRTLLNSIRDLVKGESKLGVLATHASIVDALAIAAVNSGRAQAGVERFDEIGGQFGMEQFAVLTVTEDDAYQDPEAVLERDGQRWHVDLRNLVELYSGF